MNVASLHDGGTLPSIAEDLVVASHASRRLANRLTCILHTARADFTAKDRGGGRAQGSCCDKGAKCLWHFAAGALQPQSLLLGLGFQMQANRASRDQRTGASGGAGRSKALCNVWRATPRNLQSANKECCCRSNVSSSHCLKTINSSGVWVGK